jgi:hypothetical protein
MELQHFIIEDGAVPQNRDYFSLQQSLPQVLPASLQHSAQDLPLSEQHFLQASPAMRLVERAARARMERIVFMMLGKIRFWVSLTDFSDFGHEIPGEKRCAFWRQGFRFGTI